MDLELKDTIAIWGAITGTVGTIVGVYAWWLNKRLSTPRVVITRTSGKIVSEFERGAELQFECSLASQSNVAATVASFELDLGKKLNASCTTWARYHGVSRPRLTHYTTIGKAGMPFGDQGTPPEYDKSLLLPPNGLISPVHLRGKIYVKDDADSRSVTELKARIRKKRYSLIARLASGSQVVFPGKNVEVNDG
ncbi:MAG: hypothetical protein HY017_04245 [Betaproteobacteria bacterium]|nr:hypothetical protein [Betaproteobacteria bacterium]